jgi:branched-chain amino acid transport system ATP-binding protein
VRERLANLRDEWRPSAVTLGSPAFPLGILFGLNAVDELDRTAFAVLLPDIRDHFGMDNGAALSLVAVSTIAVILFEVPLSFVCDRVNRVRIATAGAALWGLFSVATGLAPSIAALVLARLGAGLGRAVVTPTHSSLLSDWYPPAARVKVFSVHRLANSAGAVAGPAVGGLLAYWLGWRWPFLIFAVPTLVFVLLSLRLREPVRGAQERLESGADEATAERARPPESPWATMRLLSRVRTFRRIWMAVPFLGVALFGVPNLLSLIYEEVFGLSSAERGIIAAAIEPLQIVGILLSMPFVSRLSSAHPQFLSRFVALVGVVDGMLLVALAYAPNAATAIALHAVLAGSVGTLAPAFFSMLSLVAPPHVRAAAFTTLSVFAVPGIAVFLPVIGALSDSVGVQASMVVMVPISLAAGGLLAWAGSTIQADIAAVRQDALEWAEANGTGPDGSAAAGEPPAGPPAAAIAAPPP